MSRRERVGRRRGRSRLLWIACVWLVALMVASCVDPATQPPSPLPPGIDPRLVTNRWQVVEAVHQGQEVQFDAVRPFRVRFSWDGSVYYNFSCHGSHYRVDFDSEYRYQLRRLVRAGVSCPTPLDEEQFLAVARALQATHEYSFQYGWLWLTGEETRIALEVAETFPPFPAAEPRLILNRWRWVEVRDQEGMVNIEALTPIYMTFYPNEIRVEIEGCELQHRIDMWDWGGFLLRPIWDHGRCRANLAEEGQRALDALLETRDYDLQENRLILTGTNVQIVLEIDNRPSN